MAIIADLFQSKKFLVALLATLLAIGSRFAPGLADLDPVELAALLSPLIAYIIGQGIADHGKEAAIARAATSELIQAELLEVRESEHGNRHV